MVPAKWTVVFKPRQTLEERVAKECRDAVDESYPGIQLTMGRKAGDSLALTNHGQQLQLAWHTGHHTARGLSERGTRSF